MKLILERKVKSISKFLAYLMKLDVKVYMCILKNGGGQFGPLKDSEEGLDGRAKIHYVDFEENLLGLLEWDHVRGTYQHSKVRLFVEEEIENDAKVKAVVDELKKYPDDPRPASKEEMAHIMALEAQALFESRDFTRAKFLALKISRMNPLMPRIWNCLGACLAAEGKNDQAIRYYLKAIRVDRLAFRTWSNLGNRYTEAGDKFRSLLANRIASVTPSQYRGDDEIRNSVLRGLHDRDGVAPERLLLLGKRDKELNMLWDNMWDKSPIENPNYNTARELLHSGMFKKAIVAMRRAVKETETDKRVWNDLAHCELHGGDLNKGLKAIDRALRLDDKFLIAMSTKAEILMKLGRTDEALEVYDKAAVLDATCAGIIYSKALAEDKLGLNDEAEQTFKQFIVVSNDKYENQRTYAKIRLQEYEYWKQ